MFRFANLKSLPKIVKMDEQLLRHDDYVRCVALRNNGHVASGSGKGSIIINSTSSNKVEYQADNVFAGGVEGLCYLLNGSLVAVVLGVRVPS